MSTELSNTNPNYKYDVFVLWSCKPKEDRKTNLQELMAIYDISPEEIKEFESRPAFPDDVLHATKEKWGKQTMIELIHKAGIQLKNAAKLSVSELSTFNEILSPPKGQNNQTMSFNFFTNMDETKKGQILKTLLNKYVSYNPDENVLYNNNENVLYKNVSYEERETSRETSTSNPTPKIKPKRSVKHNRET